MDDVGGRSRGDVPYSEALRAGEGILTPAYDEQQDIYMSLLQELEDAAGMLQAGGAGFGSGDILYSNDFEKWRRFANSLRMRLAMRMSEVDAAAARTEFAAAHTAGGFTSNADNAALSRNVHVSQTFKPRSRRDHILSLISLWRR